ncbi:AraC family transcriptional regulator [Alkalimonas collagenimarina]|uniref:AraC family transcriptional regulator n=1 Tax=Alkalimonas collagenimarina TaxID=400390 RepID=A0ABT9H0G5_9GAMM|nr:AraC family transcriptional regulator [Alkalimonas collagenimarina]MDP4536786.1 AraC family transcriptional regulator [Alkalimonas collagenimarina]
MTKRSVTNEVYLPRHYLRNLLDLVKSRGGNPSAILAAAGLSIQDTGQLNASLSWPQFQAIIRSSCAETQEPALGLYLGSQLTITTHGLLGLATMSSRNLQEGIELLCKFTSTRSPLLRVSMQRHQRSVYLVLTELHPLADIRLFVVETFTVALHAMLEFVSGHQYRIQQVELAFQQPQHSELYQAFFPCKVGFEKAEHKLIFSVDDLALASPWADQQVKAQLTAQCEQELQHWQQQQSMAGLIRLMLGRTKGRIPGIEQVAAEFAVSSRTLRRRLAEEDTSYQCLVDDWRQQMASQYLLTTALPVQQIGYLLGYADAANFGRAFRRQQGIAPQQFREQQTRQIMSK